jgi:hypothetical protein
MARTPLKIPTWLTGELVICLLLGGVAASGVGVWLAVKGYVVVSLALILLGFVAFIAGCALSTIRSLMKSTRYDAPARPPFRDLSAESVEEPPKG